MKRLLCLSAAVATTLLLAGCSSQEEMAPKPAPAPAPAAKAEAKAPAEKAINTAMQEGGDITVEVILRRSLRLLAKG